MNNMQTHKQVKKEFFKQNKSAMVWYWLLYPWYVWQIIKIKLFK